MAREMDLAELQALYDQEQRIEIEYPGVRKEVLPGLVRFVRPAPGMNFVLYSHLDEADVDAAIQEQIAYFSQMDQPFEWVVYDHDRPPILKERLLAHGFEPDDPGAIMLLDLQEPPESLAAPVTANVRRLTRADQLDDVVQVEEQVWGRGFAWLKRRLGEHLAVPDYLSVYAVYVDDRPVCTGWIYFHHHSQFANLWGGSTVPGYRRQGLYTAVLAVRVQEAIRRDYRFVTIDAESMSQRIVARHGFRLLTYAQSYEWKGTGPVSGSG